MPNCTKPRSTNFDCPPISWSGRPRGLHANLDRCSGGARGNVVAVAAAIAIVAVAAALAIATIATGRTDFDCAKVAGLDNASLRCSS